MKLINELIKYLNAYISLLLYIQSNQNMLIPTKNKKKKEYLQSNKKQDIKKHQKNLIDKN